MPTGTPTNNTLDSRSSFEAIEDQEEINHGGWFDLPEPVDMDKARFSQEITKLNLEDWKIHCS